MGDYSSTCRDWLWSVGWKVGGDGLLGEDRGGVGCECGLGGLGLGIVPGDREKNDVTGDWDSGRRAGDAEVPMRCCGTPSFCCWRSRLSFQISVADSARILDSVRRPCCRVRSFLSFKIRRAGRRRWSSSIKLARMS